MPDIFQILLEVVRESPFGFLNEDFDSPCFYALNALVKNHLNHSETIALLHDRALNDPDEQLREWAQQQLEQRKDNS